MFHCWRFSRDGPRRGRRGVLRKWSGDVLVRLTALGSAPVVSKELEGHHAVPKDGDLGGDGDDLLEPVWKIDDRLPVRCVMPKSSEEDVDLMFRQARGRLIEEEDPPLAVSLLVLQRSGDSDHHRCAGVLGGQGNLGDCLGGLCGCADLFGHQHTRHAFVHCVAVFFVVTLISGRRSR